MIDQDEKEIRRVIAPEVPNLPDGTTPPPAVTIKQIDDQIKKIIRTLQENDDGQVSRKNKEHIFKLTQSNHKAQGIIKKLERDLRRARV